MNTKQKIGNLALKAGIFNHREHIYSLRRISPKLHRQCENSCNGAGYIPRKGMFYTGTIDDYTRKEYGYNVKNGNVGDQNVFDIEIDRLEAQIKEIVKQIPGAKVEIQHDPRGWEIKLVVNGFDISEAIYN